MIRESVLESQWVARPNIGEPLLKAVRIKELADTVPCGHVEVVSAFGTDVKPALDLFTEDDCLALRAAHPEAFRHAAFLPGHSRHGGLHFENGHDLSRDRNS